MDAYPIRYKSGKLSLHVIIALSFILFCLQNKVVSGQTRNGNQDSSTLKGNNINPSTYIHLTSLLFFKGGFNTDLTPDKFILGTRFNTSSTGMEIGIGLPVYRYFGICGQYHLMTTETEASNYNIVESKNYSSSYKVGRYQLSSFSAGIMFTLPTRSFSFEFELRAGNVHFFTPVYAMLLVDRNYSVNGNYIVDRPSHTYSTIAYSYSFQGRYFVNKYFTVLLRISNYIIPKLMAPSVNLDTRMPGNTANSNPDISFNYQCIGIGLGIKLPGLNLH